MVTLRLSLLLVAAICSVGCVDSTNDLVGPKGEGATFDQKLLGDWVMTDAETETYYDYRITINDHVIISSPLRERYIEEEFARCERKAPDSNTYLIWGFRVPKPQTEGEKPEPVKDDEKAIEAHLVKLGDHLFLTFPLTHEEPRSYIFWKIDRMDSELIGSQLDSSFIQKHPDIVSHRLEGTGSQKSVRLTATTEELREFLVKHADVAAAWEKPQSFGHRRAAEP